MQNVRLVTSSRKACPGRVFLGKTGKTAKRLGDFRTSMFDVFFTSIYITKVNTSYIYI